MVWVVDLSAGPRGRGHFVLGPSLCKYYKKKTGVQMYWLYTFNGPQG